MCAINTVLFIEIIALIAIGMIIGRIITNNRFKLNDKVYLDKDKLFIWPDLNNDINNNYGTCKGGKTQLAILVDGTITPCCLDNNGIINLGNIFDCNIKDVLNTISASS